MFKRVFYHNFFGAVFLIEIELMLNDLQKMYNKEKSLRKRILLENAITNLKDYERDVEIKEDLETKAQA